MYVVYNCTNKCIILSDLRAEIGPRKIIDLERVSPRESIDRSPDLRAALKMNRLRLVKHTVVRSNSGVSPSEPKVIEKTIERTIEKQTLDEDRLKVLISEAVAESRTSPDLDIENKVAQAMGNSVDKLVDRLRDQLNIGILNEEGKKLIETPIDPARLAEIQQKSIKKITDNIEVGGSKPKRINITNRKSVTDLADEI